MQHACIIHVSTIKVSQTLLVFLDHFGHALSSITFVDIDSLIIGVVFSSSYIFFSLFQFLLHSHLIRHEMSIDL